MLYEHGSVHPGEMLVPLTPGPSLDLTLWSRSPSRPEARLAAGDLSTVNMSVRGRLVQGRPAARPAGVGLPRSGQPAECCPGHADASNAWHEACPTGELAT